MGGQDEQSESTRNTGSKRSARGHSRTQQGEAYLVFREGYLHVVVEAVVEHVDRVLAQLGDAARPHGQDGDRQPWREQARAGDDQPDEATRRRKRTRWGQLAAGRARQGHHRQQDAEECMCGSTGDGG